MTKEINATKKPWVIDTWYGDTIILDSDGKIICGILYSFPEGAVYMDEEDAKLIVAAVNAYDKNQETIKELREALQFAQTFILEHTMVSPDNTGTLQIVKQALLKSKGLCELLNGLTQSERKI